MQIKYLPNPGEFLIDSGLLFEINRRVLHPYGLALAVTADTTQEPRTAEPMMVWDYRDDPEGINFADEGLREGEAKLAATVEAFQGKFGMRREALGYVIQGMSQEQSAVRAYTAYGNSTGWVNFMGKPMPAWEELPETIREAWRAAAAALVEP